MKFEQAMDWGRINRKIRPITDPDTRKPIDLCFFSLVDWLSDDHNDWSAYILYSEWEVKGPTKRALCGCQCHSMKKKSGRKKK
jgi:hypothetical protein